MFFTYSSSNQRYIIEASFANEAKSILSRLNIQGEFVCTIPSSIEPSVHFSEISAVIPTTILYQDGTFSKE